VFVAITIHHHVPEHEQALRAFMKSVADAVANVAGLIEFTTCRDVDGLYLAGYSRWESQEAFRQVLPAIRAHAPCRDPAWTRKPDEAIRLITLPYR
jgi:heme-degrading monooxygenase HmoA